MSQSDLEGTQIPEATSEPDGEPKPVTEESEPKTSSEPGQAEPEASVVEEEEGEEPDDGVPRVLVTGASGFIALQLIKTLLEEGRFRVRGTVRSKKSKAKIQPLLDLVPNAKYPLRLFEADLLDTDSWNRPIQSCTYVIHIASPCPPFTDPITPEEADERVIRPAMEGTMNILKACASAGTVKRLIYTSSTVTVSSGFMGNPGCPPGYVYSEKDWSDESLCNFYARGKMRAEKAAFEFVEKGKQFELVVLNPGYVQGPYISQASGEGSKAMCLSLLTGKFLAIPDVHLMVVDINDLVAAYMVAMVKPEAAGGRYILVSETVPLRDIAVAINNEFKPQGYKVPTLPIPKFAVRMLKLVNSPVSEFYPIIGRVIKYNTEKMRGELGIQPRKAIESMIDTCYSLIEMGDVEKKPGYLGHPSTRSPPPKEEPAAPEQSADDEATPATKEPESEPAKESESEPAKELESEPKEPESEPAKEPESEPAKESESEPTKESKSEPAKETESESAKETESEPTREPESEAVKEPESEPVKEPEFEPVKELESEPTKEPESEPAKEPESEPVEEPESELAKEPESEPPVKE